MQVNDLLLLVAVAYCTWSFIQEVVLLLRDPVQRKNWLHKTPEMAALIFFVFAFAIIRFEPARLAWAAIGFSCWCALVIVVGFKTGVAAFSHNIRRARRTQPKGFWAIQLWMFACGVFAAYAGLTGEFDKSISTNFPN